MKGKGLPQPYKKVTVETTEKFYFILDGSQIIDLLRRAGIAVPATASICFEVPGGADWSNTSLDVDGDNPVHVRWDVVKTEDA